MFQNYKILPYLALWSVFIIVVCDVAAGKLTNFFGITLPITIYFFPIIYIISDILTEVYGYAAARRVLWCTIAARLGAAFLFLLVAIAPAAPNFAENEAYKTVLGLTPQIAVAGVIALFAGDSTNNFVLAKMKIWTNGKFQSTRLVASTLCGEFMHTAIFYTIGLWGVMPPEMLIKSIIVGTLVKTALEFVLLPLTTRIIAHVKRVERIDHYDRDTDFNPFKV